MFTEMNSKHYNNWVAYGSNRLSTMKSIPAFWDDRQHCWTSTRIVRIKEILQIYFSKAGLRQNLLPYLWDVGCRELLLWWRIKIRGRKFGLYRSVSRFLGKNSTLKDVCCHALSSIVTSWSHDTAHVQLFLLVHKCLYWFHTVCLMF